MPVFRNESNGTWYVMTRYVDWQGNHKQKCKRGFKTKREALEWERVFHLQQSTDMDMSFESFVDIYKNDIRSRIKETTWLTKVNIIDKKILPYFGKRKISEIQTKEVIAWQNDLLRQKDKTGKPYSECYLKTIHNQLSAIFNHAVRFYALRTNSAAKAGNMGNEKRKEMLFWTKEEYLRFADVMMDKPVSYYAFEMLYWSGMRLGELLALIPSDFDFQNSTVTINKSYQRLHGEDVITTPKTKRSNRTIKMSEFLAEEMQEYIKMQYEIEPTDRLFPISKSYLHREMERGCKETGLQKIRIHDLRHPYVKHTTKIFSLRLMNFQAQAYPDAQRKTRGACQLHRGEQSRSSVRPLCNRKQFPCLSPQSKISRILYAISMRLSGYTSTRSISSSASSVVSVSASKIALDASLRLSCRACSSCFCFACANTAA